MKTIRNIIMAGLAAVAMSSCSDFLDLSPHNTLDPETTMTDDIAKALTLGCYRTLQSSNMYNQRIWTLDIVAGNSEVGAGGGTDGIETIQAADFITQSDNAMALYMWRSPWVGIGQCNTTIQSLNSASGLSEEIRNQSLGEAYFLRVYEQIIKDCQEGIDRLPAKADYSDDDKGRACKESAMAMMADIYLTLAPDNKDYYAKAEQLCKDITAMGYDLANCRYEDNFDATINNGPESLFEVQYSGSTEEDFWGNNPQMSWLSTFMGPRNSDMVAGSYGWNLPTQEFVEQYEEGDLRKDMTILYEGCPPFDGKDYKSSWSNTGYNVRKFLVPKSVSPEFNTSPANFVVYRYADVLLMEAEALNEQGLTDEAAVPLNIVRKRAGLPGVSGLSQAEMREKIIHERRIELAFEGHRWFDMIRLEHGDYAINFLRSIGKGNVTKDRLLFPIPQTEMDANPLLKQNPGY